MIANLRRDLMGPGSNPSTRRNFSKVYSANHLRHRLHCYYYSTHREGYNIWIGLTNMFSADPADFAWVNDDMPAAWTNWGAGLILLHNHKLFSQTRNEINDLRFFNQVNYITNPSLRNKIKAANFLTNGC